jgi:hypothetical protein
LQRYSADMNGAPDLIIKTPHGTQLVYVKPPCLRLTSTHHLADVLMDLSESVCRLQAPLARVEAMLAAQVSEKPPGGAKREKRPPKRDWRDRVVTHFTYTWFVREHRKNPNLRPYSLATAVRDEVAKLHRQPDHPHYSDYKRYDEITDYRAKQFFKLLEDPGEPGEI